MSHRSKQRYRRREPSAAKKALAKGIVPIRREIAPESYKLFKDIGKDFKNEFGGAGRVYDEDSIAVTLVGLSRFDKRLLGQGPRTAEIIKKVTSTRSPLPVKLGSLGVYGTKLAFELHATEIYDEIAELEKTYAQRGFPLSPHPHAGKEGYVAHCTVVNLYQQGRDHFEDIRAIEQLNAIAGVLGQNVTLRAVELPSFK